MQDLAAVYKVIRIDHLLVDIMHNLTALDLMHCCLVCRDLLEPALDHLYSSVDAERLRALLNLIAPLVVDVSRQKSPLESGKLEFWAS